MTRIPKRELTITERHDIIKSEKHASLKDRKHHPALVHCSDNDHLDFNICLYLFFFNVLFTVHLSNM